MARKVWFQLIDAVTRGSYADTLTASVSSDGANDVEDLQRKIHAEYDDTKPSGRNLLAHLAPNQLKIYATRESYDDKDGKPLKGSAPVENLGYDDDCALIVEVPTKERSGVAVVSTEMQWENLLNMLEWKEPKRLCGSSGQNWSYQGAPELAKHLVEPLIEHYNAWQCGNEDKQNHAINLVLSGPGT